MARLIAVNAFRNKRTPDVCALGVVVLVAIAAIWAGTGVGGGIPRGDSRSFFIPMYTFMGEQLRSGNIPGWNPYFFAGSSFVGDPESGWMYFPAMILFTILPAVLGYTIFTAFHLLLAGIATYIFGRVLNFGVLAALAAAVIYQLSAGTEGVLCCSVRTQVASWIPLAMLGIELSLRSRSLLRQLAWLALTGFVVSQILSAWLGQGAYYGLLAVGSYVAFRTVICPLPKASSLKQRFVSLVITSVTVLGAGFGLAAAGILPRIDSVSRSTVAGGEYQGTSAAAGDTGGWHRSLAVFRLLAPDDIYLRYQIPGVVLALALIGVLVAREKPFAIYFFLYSLWFFVLTMKTTVLHELLYLLPRFQVLHEHVPQRALLAFSLGPAMLAGAAIDAFARLKQRSEIILASLLVPSLVLMSLAFWLMQYEHEYSAPLYIGFFVAVIILAVWYVISSNLSVNHQRFRQLSNVVIPLLLIIAVTIDPSVRVVKASLENGRPFDLVPAYLSDLPCLDKVEGASRFLRERSASEVFRYFGHDPQIMRLDDGRLWDYNGHLNRQSVQALLVSNQSLCLEIQDIQGYNPVQNLRFVEYMAALNGQSQEYHSSQVLPDKTTNPMLLALNARYIVIPATNDPGRPDLIRLLLMYPTVYSDEDVRILKNTSAFDRAWIVHHALEVSDGGALATMTERNVDLRSVAVIEEPPPELAESANPAADTATVTDFGTDSKSFAVSTDAAGILMLSEIYDPGWKATVNGESVDLLVADHALSAVPIAAGESVVELRYDPLPLKVGLAITGVTSIAVLGVFVAAILQSTGRLPAFNRKPGGPRRKRPTFGRFSRALFKRSPQRE